MNGVEKITCSVHEAMTMSGLGKTKMFELIAAGKVQTVKVGTRRLVRMDSLRELLTHVPTNVSSTELSEPLRTRLTNRTLNYQGKSTRTEPKRT